MQLKINNWAWTSWSLGCCNSTTITTVGTRTGTPGAQVQMSELIAMDDTGAEVTKVLTAEQPRVTTRPARHGGHHTVEHRRLQCGGLAGRVLLTPTPHGGCATPAVSARNETPDAPGRPAAPRQGPRRSPWTQKSAPDAPAPPRGHQPTPTQVSIERSSQLSRRTARMRAAYVRASLCAPSELSLCVGRICAHSTGGAYALALLAIGALGESLSLSDKTKPGK